TETPVLRFKLQITNHQLQMTLRLTKITLFLAALIPLERLLWKALHDSLGANPIEVITHSTGDWTLIFVNHAIHHASAPHHPPILADRSPPHGRPVRILLWNFTFPHLHLARQVFRSPRNVERHRKAPLHHRRFHRVRLNDSPSPDLDRLVDPPPRRQKLAASAPSHLSHRNPGCSALHLA